MQSFSLNIVMSLNFSLLINTDQDPDADFIDLGGDTFLEFADNAVESTALSDAFKATIMLALGQPEQMARYNAYLSNNSLEPVALLHKWQYNWFNKHKNKLVEYIPDPLLPEVFTPIAEITDLDFSRSLQFDRLYQFWKTSTADYKEWRIQHLAEWKKYDATQLLPNFTNVYYKWNTLPISIDLHPTDEVKAIVNFVFTSETGYLLIDGINRFAIKIYAITVVNNEVYMSNRYYYI